MGGVSNKGVMGLIVISFESICFLTILKLQHCVQQSTRVLGVWVLLQVSQL